MIVGDFDSQVCLVSEQPLPNLAAALDPALGRPTVVLLESPHMARRADHLEAVLARHGRRVIRRPLADPDDLLPLRDTLAALCAEFPHTALNATGGLKTMSILAYDVWRAAGRPVFYIERDNRVLWLNPVENPPSRVFGGIGLEEYFAAFGQRLVQRRDVPDPDDGAGRYLARLATFPKPKQGDHDRMGEKFESLVFRVAQTALQASAARDHAEIAWAVKTDGAEGDELDVVAVRDNVLFLVECKNKGHVSGEFNAFLNKLETLRRKRGITARAALITTAPIAPNGGHARRAREAGLLLLGRDDLAALQNTFTRWFQGAR